MHGFQFPYREVWNPSSLATNVLPLTQSRGSKHFFSAPATFSSKAKSQGATLQSRMRWLVGQILGGKAGALREFEGGRLLLWELLWQLSGDALRDEPAGSRQPPESQLPNTEGERSLAVILTWLNASNFGLILELCGRLRSVGILWREHIYREINKNGNLHNNKRVKQLKFSSPQIDIRRMDV